MVSEVEMNNILVALNEINDKLDRLLLQQDSSSHVSQEDNLNELDVMTLLSLPDHLRTTATILFEMGTATAAQISEKTSKERAVESNYLNQLVRMGHVHKYRNGRKVFFTINTT
jgi:predicted transcriptional regulator